MREALLIFNEGRNSERHFANVKKKDGILSTEKLKCSHAWEQGILAREKERTQMPIFILFI